MIKNGIPTRRLIAGLVAATMLLLVAILALGVISSRRLVGLVTEQFNTQQLMLARQVAQNIETQFHFLRNDLVGLAEFSAEEAGEPDVSSLRLHQERLKSFGVLEIRFYDREGNLLAGTAPAPRQLGPGPLESVLVTARSAPLGELVMGQCFCSPAGDWLQLAATPVGPGRDRALVAVLDPLFIAGSAAGPVRSGETGYAFVINHRGYFLAHYEKQFVGQDAFKARAGRDPMISFERINRIQKDYMLEGREGTSWYVSGWHRQEYGQIKKLIAYAPVHLGTTFWSVAVVAPVAEVNGIIGSLQLEQWLLAGLAVLVVVVGFGAAIYFSIRWSGLLAVEVDAKTAALRHSESQLRDERDKVKESLRQLVEAQDQLIRWARLAAIGEAAAKVCHEVKNPLMVIGGFAGQLLRNTPEGGKDREKLAIIVDEVDRLESMMVEVGDFTKPTKLNKQLVDLGQLARQVQEMMAEEMTGRGIEFEMAADAALPPVSCDPEKVKQVLINLVKNAAESMPEGGTLRLVSRSEPGWACLDVIDTGKGIPPEHMEAVFTPFFTTKKGGSGLGLSVCFKLIQDHGGRIEAKSEPKEGSTFSVLLPLAPPAEKRAEDQSQPQ